MTGRVGTSNGAYQSGVLLVGFGGFLYAERNQSFGGLVIMLLGLAVGLIGILQAGIPRRQEQT